MNPYVARIRRLQAQKRQYEALHSTMTSQNRTANAITARLQVQAYNLDHADTLTRVLLNNHTK